MEILYELVAVFTEDADSCTLLKVGRRIEENSGFRFNLVGLILRFIDFADFSNLCEKKNSHIRGDGPLQYRTSEQ